MVNFLVGVHATQVFFADVRVVPADIPVFLVPRVSVQQRPIERVLGKVLQTLVPRAGHVDSDLLVRFYFPRNVDDFLQTR